MCQSMRKSECDIFSLSFFKNIYIYVFWKCQNLETSIDIPYFHDKHLSRFSGWFELPNKYYLVVSSSIRKNAKNRGKFTTRSIKLKCQKTQRKKYTL